MIAAAAATLWQARSRAHSAAIVMLAVCKRLFKLLRLWAALENRNKAHTCVCRIACSEDPRQERLQMAGKKAYGEASVKPTTSVGW